MSTDLYELIDELCPDGVKFVKISDVFTRLKGTPITATKMKEIACDDGEIRIFAGGKTVVDAHEKNIPKANITRVPAVLVQSRGVIDFVYYEHPFTFKNEMWAYTHKNKASVKFLYYVLKNNVDEFRKKAAGMGSLPQISLRVTENFEIPLPPLPVQAEIVRILDKFTELIATLQKELELRHKQYAYYRDLLLSPEHLYEVAREDNVREVELGDVSQIYDGTHQTPKYTTSGVPFISVENINDIYGSSKYISHADFEKYKIKPQIGDVFMTRIGSIGKCAVMTQDADLAYYVPLALIRPNKEQLTPNFLKYMIESSIGEKELYKRTLHFAIPIKVNKGDIGKIKIPLPPLPVQREIATTLDKFDTLVNSLTEGIPAEIEGRKKQYAYYRDKLLDFRRIEI